MNTLEAYIKAKNLDECEAMNILQDHGIISDCAVWARDVANENEAIAFLESRHDND